MRHSEELTSVAYVCPSCAARFLALQSRDATTCPYCESVLEPSEVGPHQASSPLIVPFAIARDKAEEIVIKHLGSKGLLRKRVAPTIEEVHAVSVPFYLYDLFVYGDVDFEGKGENSYGSRDAIRFHYKMRVRGYGEFAPLLVCASTGLPISIAEKIPPYDLDKSRSCDDSDGLCQLVETSHRPASIALARATNAAYDAFLQHALKYVRQTAQEDLPPVLQNKTLLFKDKTYPIMLTDGPLDRGHDVAVLESKLVWLPVWIIWCSWKEEDRLLIINGQTGTRTDVWRLDETTTDSYPIATDLHMSFRHLRVKRLTPYIQTLEPWHATRSIFEPQNPSRRRERTGMRRIAMLDSATQIAQQYNQYAARTRPAAHRHTPAIKQFVPFEEHPIPIYDETKVNDVYYGFAITDAGLWFAPVDPYPNYQGEVAFTSWEEFAWADKPVCAVRHGQRIMYSFGNAIAYLPDDELLRREFLRMYDSLREKARQLYEWKWFVSTQAETAAAIVMSNAARTACSRTAKLMPHMAKEPNEELHYLLRLGKYEEFLLLHDDARRPDDYAAFMITARGFTCRERGKSRPARSVGWRELAEAPRIEQDGEFIRAGETAIACYSGGQSDMDALFALCKDLHAKAREVYKSRTALFLEYR